MPRSKFKLILISRASYTTAAESGNGGDDRYRSDIGGLRGGCGSCGSGFGNRSRFGGSGSLFGRSFLDGSFFNRRSEHRADYDIVVKLGGPGHGVERRRGHPLNLAHIVVIAVVDLVLESDLCAFGYIQRNSEFKNISAADFFGGVLELIADGIRTVVGKTVLVINARPAGNVDAELENVG